MILFTEVIINALMSGAWGRIEGKVGKPYWTQFQKGYRYAIQSLLTKFIAINFERKGSETGGWRSIFEF